MLPEKYDTVGNAWDDDLGTVLEVDSDSATVQWEDGSITHETLSLYGDQNYWFPASV